MLQLGNTVEATGLGADGGDWCLEHNAISKGWKMKMEIRQDSPGKKPRAKRSAGRDD